MNKFVRPTLLATLVVAAFSAQAQYSQNNYGGSYSGSNFSNGNSCESSDGSRRSESLQVVGLVSDQNKTQRLICFNERNPGEARNLGTVTGLTAGDELIGIDFRVQDKKLYGVGKAGGIYILDTTSAIANPVGKLTEALEGDSFGVDFNPAADRLRIVSDKGQNLRHNVNPGGTTTVDDPLDYPLATPVNSKGPIALGVAGSAYTNNDLDDSTATTLYALDTVLDQVAVQSPPNDGTLAATGKLGVDVNTTVGFDIYSTVRNNVTVNVQALASLQIGSGSLSLYSVSLPTGKATLRGSFSSQNKVIDIAIPLNQL